MDDNDCNCETTKGYTQTQEKRKREDYKKENEN